MVASTKQQEIAQYAKDLIHHTARKMVGKAGLGVADVEDLESDLMVRLIESLPKFNPKRATYNTFVANVVKVDAAKVLRERLRERRDPSREACSLNEHIEAETGHKTERAETLSREEDDQRLGGRSEEEKCDMTLDVADILRRLPEDLRALCGLLKTESVSEAARQLGIPQSTAASQVKRLRRVFRKAGLANYL